MFSLNRVPRAVNLCGAYHVSRSADAFNLNHSGRIFDTLAAFITANKEELGKSRSRQRGVDFVFVSSQSDFGSVNRFTQDSIAL